MAEYKDTLNLPHTDFPMKASLAQREPNFLKNWQTTQLYQQIRATFAGKKSFILHDGPPYANGHLHCGHALNKILKDIIVKSKTFSGFDAPFVPGWDCHGLPIELNVEKKVGKANARISAADFRRECRKYAATQINIQKEEFKRLGVFGDWDNPYVTMDFTYEANIIRALAKVIENGHLHRGFKPVHWCVECGSALAEAEVDYENKVSPSIDVAFVAKIDETPIDIVRSLTKPLIVPIWTTTPWTLPANEAVCLHPQLDYCIIETPENCFVIAEALLESVVTRYGIAQYNIVGTLKGQLLEGMKVLHPFQTREVPIILGEHVTTDAGTGCVHTAPAHGPDDYNIGLHYHLPFENPVLSNGCFANHLKELAGVHVFKANPIIIDMLRAHHSLLHEATIEHSYPHCWRHKTPMIFLATPQWFISMEAKGLREILLQQIEQVSWVPAWGKERIRSMVETRPDWCISRQRSWGTPIPLFVHKETKEVHPQSVQLLEEIAQQVEKQGIDAWFDLDINSFLEDAAMYEKVLDTLDVWFDSGVTHYCVLEMYPNLQFPADLYLEGSDQHRGWFNSSLTTSVAMHGVPPYRQVLTHGYTVDAEGRKLSKSKGNYVALDQLISQYGADVLRLWVASTDYRNEVSISDEIMTRAAEGYRRIRNTARFLLANLFDFDPKAALAPNEMVALDKWAIVRTKMLQTEVLAAYEQYQFHVIYQKIHNFCAVELGSFYLDIIKDRQYTTPTDSRARRSCQTAMYHILQALTRLLAPILSFTAEEIWQYLPGEKSASVFLEQWYDAWPAIEDVDVKEWQTIALVRDAVNKAMEDKRQAGVIGSSLAAEVTVYAPDMVVTLLSQLKEELRFVFITSGASVLPYAMKTDAAIDQIVSEPNLDNKKTTVSFTIAVEVNASTHQKCNRCWHRSSTIGQHADHPDICQRCADNITGQDEIRLFA